LRSTKAFSSEVETGSRKENAPNQESRASFRFNNGKGSSGTGVGKRCDVDPADGPNRQPPAAGTALTSSLQFGGILHPMAESRRAPRHIVLKAGTVKSGGAAVNCLVRNLSKTGPALEVSDESRIPGRFVLVVPGDGLHLPCRIVWRKPRRVGVVFG
jgi:hypothetical protein